MIIHWKSQSCHEILQQVKVQKVCYTQTTRLYPSFTSPTTYTWPLSGTIQVSRYQKGKINLDFTGARHSEWQWHWLGNMQVSTSLQTDNHVSTSLLSFFRLDALPAANQQRQSTEYEIYQIFNKSLLQVLPQCIYICLHLCCVCSDLCVHACIFETLNSLIPTEVCIWEPSKQLQKTGIVKQRVSECIKNIE